MRMPEKHTRNISRLINIINYQGSILILGAGFIGSNLTEKLVNSEYKVIALDGFLDQTGGSKTNIDSITDQVNIIDQKIESVANLFQLVKSVDIITDCMARTSHLSSMTNPFMILS